jgi:hypothetical protein
MTHVDIALAWADNEIRQQQQEAAELKALADQNDLKSVLETEAGRRVIRRLLNHTGLYAASFTPSQSDISAFREGRRDVGIWLNAQILTLPDLYLKLMTEEFNGHTDD